MRHRVRHLPAFLGLGLPLAALAWLGSSELGRQSELAKKVLFEHAMTFLREVGRELEHEVGTHTKVVEQPVEIDFQPLVQVDQQLRARDPHGTGLIVLDGDASIIYPDPAPSRVEELPFHRVPRTPELRSAEELIALADYHGARQILEDFIDNSRQRRARSSRVRARAYFRLGSVQRQLGELEDAEERFRAASSWSSRYPQIRLLSELAIAEIDLDRGSGNAEIVALMKRIAFGEYYRTVGDDLLGETMLYLLDQLPPDGKDLARAEELVETDRVRRAGRAFAREYEDFSQQSARNQLRTLRAGERLHLCHDGAAGAELLVLRPIDDFEREQALSLLDDAEWIGMRFDLEALLAQTRDTLLDPTTEEFIIAIEGLDGTQILPRNAETAEDAATDSGMLWPRQRTMGMMLHVEPANPTTYLDAREGAARTHAMLILALCIVAGGGAFFLIRSVGRESEIAALKMDLVSRISHELKTPLALIRMYAETLERGRTRSPEQAAEFTGIISREANRLTTMVERVLELSRREAGTLEFEKSEVDISALVASVTDAYRPRADARSISVEAEVTPNLVAHVDGGAFESAVLNLLDNAVKYTPEDADEPNVSISLRRESHRAVVEVMDRGIGIPDGDIGQVFTSFYRASNAGEAPGAGLGLSIVKGFADGHGGTVVARSRPGGGTTFRMSVPLVNESENGHGSETEDPRHRG